jgi:hypothetical protein
MSLKDFENKSRLLSDDEKQLVEVLASFHRRLTELTDLHNALRDEVDGIKAIIGPFLTRKLDDG